jgi:alpha/beta superfamily hydrolase
MKFLLRQFPLMSLVVLCACTSSGQRIDREAESVGLSRRIVAGADFQHVVYLNAAAARAEVARLLVFLEGDGRPWGDSGREPAADPTTRNPIALRLLARANAPGIYVSRPCYQQIVDPKCAFDVWTGGRYSRVVAESLAAAIQSVASETRAREIVLVGYSGGGALAVLVAERMSNVAAVLTIAANLDVAAWTQLHGYLPLSTSLNPAVSEIEHPWRELHLSGGQDEVVPTATTAAYFKTYPAAKQWIYADFGHVCCWLNEWPAIEAEALR